MAPHDLDLGTVRGGGKVRGKLRVANNGGALLTGTVSVGPNAPWIHVLGTGEVFCAAGAVESVDIQAELSDMHAGTYTGEVHLDTDGGRATVRVSVTIERESVAPAIIAAIVTAIIVLALAALVYATNGGKMPLVATAPTATPTVTMTPVPSNTPLPTSTAAPTATTVNVAATATAEAHQALVAQQLVAHARDTATAFAANSNATATVLAANQAPGATTQRLAIQAAVNNFLLVRTRALATGDASKLPLVATGPVLTNLNQQLADLAREGDHTKIVSLEEPVWDSIVLIGGDRADATLTKHEDELAIRNSTGLPDDADPSYKGPKHTARNQRFGVTYHVRNVNGTWLIEGATVFEYPKPMPTPDSNLLPPPGQGPVGAEGTVTPVPTVAPSSNELTIEQVVKQSLPGVLRITGSIANNQQSTGTGFVIQTSGNFAYVITNDHVVNGATNITLSTQTSGPLPAVSVQEDTADDLAVIKIAQPAAPLPALKWGDSENAQLGENVVAIGFALGLKGEPTISNGILSALHRDVGQRWLYLQHTAPINHGNSGGPLLDLQGNVIGINTLLDENAQSVYFAIPAARAKQKVADLIGAMP
ncbi:MAG: protease Do [Chloroflexi bacterium]|nr:protease Do [Chloroflexota bacterium]